MVGSLGVGSTTLSETELAKLDALSGGAALAVSEMRSFTQTSGNGTYTASITVPAGALITDIKVWSTVLWNASTSAAMDVGDAADADGWFAAIDLKATDLLVGEEINFIQTGGKEGVYLVLATGARTKAYGAAARVISGIVTQVGTGTAGRSFLSVHYTLPVATAATKV